MLADGGYRGIAELLTPRSPHAGSTKTPPGDDTENGPAPAEHRIVRHTDGRSLPDHHRRDHHLPDTLPAVAYLHNLRIPLPDSSQVRMRKRARMRALSRICEHGVP